MIEESEVKDLTYWGNIYGTDKSTYHRYTDFYESILKKYELSPKMILEIGIKDGASLKMWKSRFPNSIVVGVDILDSNPIENILTLKFDATNHTELHKYLGKIKFDLIIDDGSHHSSDVINTFNYLWQNCLSDNGIYIYEDCHCSFIEEYNKNVPYHLKSAFEYLTFGFSSYPIEIYFKDFENKTDSGTFLIVNK